MRSEFQFFMTADDEDEFVSFAEKMSDSVDRDSDIQWFFLVGDCRIQLLRSRIQGGDLISGRISIATTGFGLSYDSGADGERVYKRLRSWLKKTYSNNMTCRNVNIENSIMEIRNFWMSPRVFQLLRDDPTVILKQSVGGFVVFEIRDQQAEQAVPPKSDRAGG